VRKVEGLEDESKYEGSIQIVAIRARKERVRQEKIG